MATVAWIGLGNMGHGMSANLQKALATGIPGYSPALVVYNRTISKAQPLGDLGAHVAESIHELGTATVVFSISANDASAEQIFDAWAESAAGPGDQIYVECSTILPQTSRRLAEKAAAKKVTLVAGPVFGRPDAAAAGKLTGLLAGASQDVRDKLKPLVGSYAGAALLDLGDDPGSANALKLSGNFLIAAQIELGAEFITLGQKNGVGIKELLHIHNLVCSKIASGYANRIASREFSPVGGFAVDLALKDIGHVRQLTKDVECPVPVADVVYNHLISGKASEGADIDWTGAIYGSVQRAAGLPFEYKNEDH